METIRTALLIGVGNAPEAAHHFAPLDDPVASDLRALAASLRAAGYTVETLHDGSRSAITSRISQVSRDVPADGTLLLHFSGHGIRIGDADYLVPADAQAPHDGDWRQPYVLESLLPADISPYLTACRAGTVLWLIDACRAETSEGEDPFGSRILKGPPSGRFAVMTGCGPGERCGYGPEGSHFTLGLADAFAPLTAPRTVHEVYEAAAARTLRAARRHRGDAQTPMIRYGSDLEPETRAALVTDGRRLLEAWRESAVDNPLWKRVAGDADLERLKECVQGLAAGCAATVHLAQQRLPDPWADDDFPVRLLRDRLPLLLGEGATLSPVEAAALVAAPFLHEAAWARRLSEAAEVRPLITRQRAEGDALRRHYEQVVEHYPQIAEKLSRWWQGDRDAAQSVALWLVHRWIGERFETDEEPVPSVDAAQLAHALLGGDAAGRGGELTDALCAVAGGLSLGEPPQAPEALKVRLPDDDRHQELRIRPLAALLRLAACLAVDVRNLPDVVAEHLAVSDPVLPQDVVHAARSAVWESDGTDLHLDAVCHHPAVHAALCGTAEQADEIATDLRAAARAASGRDAELLAALPARVTDRRVRPAEERGRKAYDVPLLSFHLAQTEVRGLLMGKQLYDDEPQLALREMYQNAMDACRYRAMRWRYLRGRGREPHAWTGRISFTQGEDERGRYVECRDNGVGMSVDQLKNTFTQAGRRFEQTRAFRREQADWLRHDRSLRLYPNSRFGIGVFSYFMLADEMTIVTRPVDPDGIPARKALRVVIPSSGSLFRIQEHDDTTEDGLPEGGTRVRLYLNESAPAGLSCVATLGQLVRVSEFALSARDGAGRELFREAGALATSGSSVEAVPGVLWWVEGKGAVLCDGVATDQAPFGYVLNLTGAHAGMLSVNRKKLQSYDSSWEAEQWRAGASALADWSELRLSWLWRLEHTHLGAARAVWKEWRGKGVVVRRKDWTPAVSLDDVGWFRQDSYLGGHERTYGQRNPPMQPWRKSALGSALSEYADEDGPTSLAGHPVPEPGWADIAEATNGDWRVVVSLAYRQDRTVSEALGVCRALRIAHPQLAPPPARPGDLDWEPEWQDHRVMMALLGPEPPRYTSQQKEVVNTYRHAPDDLGGVVRASAEHRLTLGELTETCARYAPFLAVPLPTVPEEQRDYVCDVTDIAVLYTFDTASREWRKTQHPWDVLRIVQRLKLDPEDVRARLARFTWLGWTVPDEETVERWRHVPPHVLPLLEDFVVSDAAGELSLPWAATLVSAAKWEEPLRKTEKYLAHWAAALGLTFTKRYGGKVPEGKLVPESALENVLPFAHHCGLRLEDGLTLRDLGYVMPHDIGWDGTAHVVEELRAFGVDVPAADNLLVAWSELPPPVRYLFSGMDSSFDGADYPVLPSNAVLFGAAAELKSPLGKTWKAAGREAQKLGLHVAELPPSLSKLRVSWEMRWALLSSGPSEDEDSEWFESPHWTPLTPAALIRYARSQHTSSHTAYQQLAPLRAIGALVPELSPAEADSLPAAVPSAADAVALDPDLRVSAAGEPLCALDLVSVAGRLGEEVSRTWQRIVPYLSMEPAPQIPSAPDVLPLWQDLTVLSVHADGRLPALSGQVSAAHLSFAAQAVDKSEEWVRDRLALYADLFELDLTALPSATPPEPEAHA